MSSIKRKKTKQYYVNQHKKNKGDHKTLQVGMKGYLCSCNNREKECLREAYNLLNKYYDVIRTKTDKEEIKEEVEDELKAEIEVLKSLTTARFQAIDSGAKNLIFVKANVENHEEIIELLVKDLKETKMAQTRYLLRIVPIETVCKATVEDIKNHIGPFLDKHFIETSKTFGIIFNSRNNNSLSKDEVIKQVAEMVHERNVANKVNLLHAEISIIIEVIKGYALLSIIPYYIEHKKYHTLKLCEEQAVTVTRESKESKLN